MLQSHSNFKVTSTSKLKFLNQILVYVLSFALLRTSGSPGMRSVRPRPPLQQFMVQVEDKQTIPTHSSKSRSKDTPQPTKNICETVVGRAWLLQETVINIGWQSRGWVLKDRLDRQQGKIVKSQKTQTEFTFQQEVKQKVFRPWE